MVRGALLAAVPSVLALALPDRPVAALQSWPGALCLTAVIALLAAAALLSRWRGLALISMWVGLLAAGVLEWRQLAASPALALLAFLLAIAASLALGRRIARPEVALSPAEAASWTARGCAAATRGLWLLGLALTDASAPFTVLALGATTLLATAAVVRWGLRHGRTIPGDARWCWSPRS
jgi:hypothetical protein